MRNTDIESELSFSRKMNHWFILIIGLLVIYIALTEAYCKSHDVDPEPNYTYVTDSTYMKKYYDLKAEIDKGGKVTPPKIVKMWLKPEPVKIDSLSIINNAIAIYKDKEKKPVIINADFATSNITSAKLLQFDLNKDTLSITIQKPDAQIVTTNYPLYFKHFRYQWYDNELHHYEVKPSDEPKKSSMSWKDLYINGGYEMLQKKGTIGLEYNLEPGRFKIDLNSQMTLEQSPQFYLNAKLGYRLFK